MTLGLTILIPMVFTYWAVRTLLRQALKIDTPTRRKCKMRVEKMVAWDHGNPAVGWPIIDRQSGAVLGHMIRGVDGGPYYQVRSIAGGAWSMPAGNPAQALALMPSAAVSS